MLQDQQGMLWVNTNYVKIMVRNPIVIFMNGAVNTTLSGLKLGGQTVARGN